MVTHRYNAADTIFATVDHAQQIGVDIVNDCYGVKILGPCGYYIALSKFGQ